MSWQKLKLGEFLINRQNRFKPNDKSISGLKRIDKIDFSGEIFLSNKPSNTDMILVKKGDLVISGINVEKGAMSVYQGDEDVTATIHYSSYTFNPKKIDIGFLKLFLRSSEFKSALKEQVPGGIKTEIKPKHLLHLEVIIPNTISEQKDLINSFAKLETQNFNLENEILHQNNLLVQLQQAFLRESMQGKLVRQDKKEGNATDLLKKIKGEKAKLIAEKKIKKEKELAPIKETEIPFSIPENWVWCRLGEIAANVEYGTSQKAEMSSEHIPVLRMNNIQDGKIDFEKLKYVQSSIDDLPKLYLKEDDLLFNRTNSYELVGKSGVYHGADDVMTFASYLIRVQFSKNISTDFVNHYINSSFCRKTQLEPEIIQQNGQANFNGTKLKNIICPLPPLAEQKRIVKKLAEVMNLCEELKTTITDNQNYTDQLLQVALKDALQMKEVEVE